MDALITSAIVGTGQQRPKAITTGTPIDNLIERLPAHNLERNLLLAAGAWSVYRQAGHSARPLALDSKVAPDESLSACSSKFATLIVTLLQEENTTLLPEALECLQQKRLRIPYIRLPEILDYGSSKADIRPALVPVLGERGRWLSQYNSHWHWVSQFLNKHYETLPDDAETIWQEGTLGQRVAILRLLRATDAPRAREWLADVWKQERAEARQVLLDTFRTGLSAEDESFLDGALNDRSEHVQRIARMLLARIPTSHLTCRATEQADKLLSCHHKKSVFSKKLVLTVHPPVAIGQEWERISFEKKPMKTQISDESWFLQQVLALVTPLHWEERFAASADDLLAAIRPDGEQAPLVVAWTAAALLHDAHHWYVPLCKWWLDHDTNNDSLPDVGDRQTAIQQLFQRLPLSEAERVLLPLLHKDAHYWISPFLLLPTPCSYEFGLACLNALRQYIDANKGSYRYDYDWARIMIHIAKMLPLSCFEEADALGSLADQDTWINQPLHKTLNLFARHIKLRKILLEEIG